MITLHDKTNGKTYTLKEGTTLLQLCSEHYGDAEPRIAAALYNNEFVGLQTKVREDGDISWFSARPSCCSCGLSAIYTRREKCL